MIRVLLSAIIYCSSMFSSFAKNDPDPTDQELFQLRKIDFVGKNVQLVGIISLADEDFGVFWFDAGRLKHGSIGFYPKDKDILWERSRLECRDMFPGEKCKAIISGIVSKEDDRIYIDKAEIKFLK